MTDQAITLIFPANVIVAGQTIYGEVELNFPILQADDIEEVHVKLRGSVFTKVSVDRGGRRHSERERRWLIRQNVSVWTHGTVYPPAESHRLRLPFTFTFPSHLPPSCQCDGMVGTASVGYLLEVVGVRSGIFHANRRVVRPLSVVSPDPIGAQIRQALEIGWDGHWTMITREKNVRRGLWGGFANVKMELQIPSIQVFPLFTPIPFTLRVVTLTKQMKHEDIPPDSQNPLYPTPPNHPKDVEFLLRRDADIAVYGYSVDDTQNLVKLGGMGSAFVPAIQDVNVQTIEKIWIPSEYDKQKGAWKQETVMQSVITLRSTPTFSFPTIRVKYYMHLEVGFPGLGNDLKADVPIEIGSGFLSQSTPSTSEDILVPMYEGPLQSLDLPPSYWSATEWGQDEKS